MKADPQYMTRIAVTACALALANAEEDKLARLVCSTGDGSNARCEEPFLAPVSD
jgi:hypothetical protein